MLDGRSELRLVDKLPNLEASIPSFCIDSSPRRYIQRAKTRKGWKTQVRGPLGDLRITESSVSLGDQQVRRGGGEVEAAIWELVQRHRLADSF